MADGSLIRSIDGHNGAVFDLAWHPSGKLLGIITMRDLLLADRSIARLGHLAASLDLAVVSAGGLAESSGSLVRQLITEAEAADLLACGCVADIMCNFIDAQGQPLDHPLNARVMSVGAENLRAARHKVLASGGHERAAAILAVIRSIGVNTLVTDEQAARAILALA